MADVWLAVAAGAFLALLLCLCAGLLFLYRRQSSERRRHEEAVAALASEIATLQDQLRSLNSGTIGVGQRLIDVEKKLLTTLENSSASEDGAPYRRAMRLVEQGNSADSLVKECGLTRAEAELLVLMHRSLSSGDEL